MSVFRTFVTAFEPFGGAGVNGSEQALLRWRAREPELEIAVLPVVRGDAETVALAAFRALDPAPDLWIALGEAGPEPVVRLEKVAINWDDFRLPDNAGNAVRDTRIVESGPDAHFATASIGACAESLGGATPLPVRISLSAGAFLCNHLAYVALDAKLPCPFVFVHVPSWRPIGDDDEDSRAPAFTGDESLESLVETLIAVRDCLAAGVSAGVSPTR